MGMDATCNIWVGTNRVPPLPEDIEEVMDGIGEYNVDGVCIAQIYGYDSYEGFGVVILHHNWDYGTKEVDWDQLVKDKEKAVEVLTKLFKEWGIDNPIKTYVQSDYS